MWVDFTIGANQRGGIRILAATPQDEEEQALPEAVSTDEFVSYISTRTKLTPSTVDCMRRTMELVREFGDPHVLTLAEDHIVLKLELPWPRGVALPQGVVLADDDGLLLIGNQQSLVSAVKSTLSRKARISKALFCGCASFGSSVRYAKATTKLLRDTQEIGIVHNRDKVYNLVRMFPNVKVLALLHDLCEHYLELDEPWRDPSAPLVERSQLRKLVGNLTSEPEGCLIMSYETTLALLRTCPHVTLGSMEAFAKISAFRNLRSLRAFWPEGDREDVGLVLKQLLEKFPDLEELGLAHCGGVVFSTIANMCREIKVLQLEDCTVSARDLTLNARAFPHLQHVEISGNMLLNTFCSFLSVTRETLRTARFGDCGMCSEFLRYCVRFGQDLPFSRLEHVALCTSHTLQELHLEPGKLHNVLKALPALRHLETDSYDYESFSKTTAFHVVGYPCLGRGASAARYTVQS
ncbi:hypothetical protein HPB52_010963 [Rhipicephalus sanguineus]|uniref:Uncharacterized protein n=1 Tax=Rhipicephalus sanguineus TaxID=34632 RepID=A0A9D4PZC2_RHISA|nr:hypothetical protein HPB52_010963 [Rhipicephalus sanguineus]